MRPRVVDNIEAECLGHAHNIEFAKRLRDAALKMRKNAVMEAK